MTESELSDDDRLELYYWMRLTRTFDDRMVLDVETRQRPGCRIQPAGSRSDLRRGRLGIGPG